MAKCSRLPITACLEHHGTSRVSRRRRQRMIHCSNRAGRSNTPHECWRVKRHRWIPGDGDGAARAAASMTEFRYYTGVRVDADDGDGDPA